MSPIEITLLLHYYAIAEPFHCPSPATAAATRRFIAAGLIVEDTGPGSGYRTTEKGNVLVKALCDTPMPRLEQRWIVDYREKYAAGAAA